MPFVRFLGESTARLFVYDFNLPLVYFKINFSNFLYCGHCNVQRVKSFICFAYGNIKNCPQKLQIHYMNLAVDVSLYHLCISVDTDRTSTPCVCLYWNSVSLTLPPSCTVSRNLWILEFHAFMKFWDFLASKYQSSYDLSVLKNVLFQNGSKSKQPS